MTIQPKTLPIALLRHLDPSSVADAINQLIHLINGISVPPGGTTGQVLEKNSNTDFDMIWGTASGGGGWGGGVGRIVTAAGAVTMTSADSIISIDKTVPATTTVNLISAPTPFVVYTVKDMAGNSATYPITLTPNGGAKIDGSSAFIININYESLSFFSPDGTNWSLV